MNRMIQSRVLALVAMLLLPAQGFAETDYGTWPILVNPFPSTGGKGVMIDGYDPKITDGLCKTDFTAILADGRKFYNEAEFDAVETQGGILCTKGRFRAKDGSASGKTPFEMFIKNGVVRRLPDKAS
jgi:hypothetical protein